jgi:photosystem II stability/assembly factor-like uncharacterized protein
LQKHKIPFYLFIFTSLFSSLSVANKTLELLDFPAINSELAIQSVLTSLVKSHDVVLTMGERGHILTKDNHNDWSQDKVPVSVSITAATVLSNGSKVAVGQDSVILTSSVKSNEWKKAFTGHDLLTLKKVYVKNQIVDLKKAIEQTEDEDEKESLLYQLEDLDFTMEDIEVEESFGPNKPLLSIATTSNDTLFATGAYGTLLTSTDKGLSWQLIEDRLNNPDKFHLNSITSINDQLYIVGENGLGFKSADEGLTWSEMAMPYSGTLFGIISNINVDTKEIQLVAFGLKGNIMVSLDSGERWVLQKNASSVTLLGGYITPNNQVYLVGHGGIVVDFNLNNPAQHNIRRHQSGAAFSAALVQNNTLILAGQFGIMQMNIK